MFHQVAYSIDYDFFRVENNHNFSFPPHAHSCFEVLFVTSGEMEVEVGGQTRILQENEAAFIFPNQVHSLKTHPDKKSTHTLCIFSNTLVRHFYKEHHQTVPSCNFCKVEPTTIDLIRKLEFEKSKSLIKGALYLVCGNFEKQATFVSCDTLSNYNSENSNTLIARIFAFIEMNSSKDCSLTKLAEILPYSYVHLSRFFKQNCGITFNEYVNRYRISEACYLLKNTSKSIIDIGAECGYSSIRSFNRNFKEITGMTPHEYINYSE